jgi:hypothetical protein
LKLLGLLVSVAFIWIGGLLHGRAMCQAPTVPVTKTSMPPAERLYPFARPLACDARMVVMAAGVVYHQACYVRTNPQVWL